MIGAEVVPLPRLYVGTIFLPDGSVNFSLRITQPESNRSFHSVSEKNFPWSFKRTEDKTFSLPHSPVSKKRPNFSYSEYV